MTIPWQKLIGCLAGH